MGNFSTSRPSPYLEVCIEFHRGNIEVPPTLNDNVVTIPLYNTYIIRSLLSSVYSGYDIKYTEVVYLDTRQYPVNIKARRFTTHDYKPCIVNIVSVKDYLKHGIIMQNDTTWIILHSKKNWTISMETGVLPLIFPADYKGTKPL